MYLPMDINGFSFIFIIFRIFPLMINFKTSFFSRALKLILFNSVSTIKFFWILFSLFERITGDSIVNPKMEANRIRIFQCYSVHLFLPGYVYSPWEYIQCSYEMNWKSSVFHWRICLEKVLLWVTCRCRGRTIGWLLFPNPRKKVTPKPKISDRLLYI